MPGTVRRQSQRHDRRHAFQKRDHRDPQHHQNACSSSAIFPMRAASGHQSVTQKNPRNVPTNAAATFFPISSGGPPARPS